MARLHTLAAGLVVLLACNRAEMQEMASDSAAARPTSSGARPTDWVVVAHRLPDASALSESDASAWHGRTLHLGIEAAISGADTCANPEYEHYMVPADSFLTVNYHIRSTDLGLAVAHDPRLRVTEVLCGGDPWMAMGGIVLWTAPDHGFAVWDGVFFELQPAAEP